MEILKMLTEQKENLYPEDIELFLAELSTGQYDIEYVHKCQDEIEKIMKRDKEESKDNNPASSAPQGIILNQFDLKAHSGEKVNKPAPEEQVKLDVKSIRFRPAYKKEFKEYISSCDMINEQFLEKNFNFFDEWERGAIIEKKPFTEEFLDRYFGTLDKEKIARYQLFSEGFFMKHFNQLDAELVLEKGKNSWRKKEARSKQLDVFLRIKGVKI